MRLIFDIARHLTPVVEFYGFGGVIERYAILTAFDLALGIIFIAATTRSGNDPTSVDPRSRSLLAQAASVVVIALLFGATALIVAMPIGLPAFLWSLSRGLDWKTLLLSPGLWMPMAFMSVSTALRAHLAFTATTAVKGQLPVENEAERSQAIGVSEERSRAANAAQVTLIGTYVALCYWLIGVPADGVLKLLPGLYSAALTFYDARPDIAERIFPELWGKPRPTPLRATGRRPGGRRKKR